MLIHSLELFHLALPRRQPITIAERPVETLETVLVRLRSGDTSGWGEASPGNAPQFGSEWAAGAMTVLRDWLAPQVVGQAIESGEALGKRLAPFRGNQFAKGALDAAWWDLHARLQGKSLPAVLGGTRATVAVGPTFDRMESPDDFLAAVGRAIAAGFPRVKLKFRPGWDIEMLRAVRQEFPAAALHIDCEAALGLQHMELLCRMDDFSLEMLEQPLPADDLVGHAMLQETVRTPICLDEGVVSLTQAEMAIELMSCRSINLKPGRVGGLTTAVAIHDVCQAGGIGCFVGAMPQTAVGARCGFALAAKANCEYPSDYFPAEEILAEDVAVSLPPVRGDDGVMRIPLWAEPGIGVEPDAAVLDKYTVARAEVRS